MGQKLAKNEEVKMVNPKAVLECPSCHWIFEVQAPDSLHPSAALEKPLNVGIVGDVLFSEGHVCRNPRCKKQFTIYWYDSKLYLNRT
jgi:hypothetical protein